MSFATSDESGKRTEKGKQGTRDLQRQNTREAARCWAKIIKKKLSTKEFNLSRLTKSFF